MDTENNDYFEEMNNNYFVEPCCRCRHQYGSDQDEPCCWCKHNVNRFPRPEVKK